MRGGQLTTDARTTLLRLYLWARGDLRGRALLGPTHLSLCGSSITQFHPVDFPTEQCLWARGHLRLRAIFFRVATKGVPGSQCAAFLSFVRPGLGEHRLGEHLVFTRVHLGSTTGVNALVTLFPLFIWIFYSVRIKNSRRSGNGVIWLTMIYYFWSYITDGYHWLNQYIMVLQEQNKTFTA